MKTAIALTLLLAASTGFAEDKPVHQDSKPNIIVIMPDDSGYGNYSCFGNPVIQTPNIDALAKQGLLLTRYHSSARCSPSRAKLMSGRHEFFGGVTDTRRMRERLSLDTITLPQVLKTAGYATGFFGKWHLYYEFMERDWLEKFWQAGLPKHHPKMHYFLNTFPHADGRGRPVGPETNPHSVLGFTKWLIEQIKTNPEARNEIE